MKFTHLLKRWSLYRFNINRAKDVPLSSLAEMKASVRQIIVLPPEDIEESGLLLSIERSDDKPMPPENGNRLKDEEIATIRKWIEDGAPEN